jgi:hypothetical protein
MKRFCAWLLGLPLALAGCGGLDMAAFEGSTPQFLPEAYFPGKTRVWGVVQDRFGTIRRQFVADVDGRWDGEVLTLEEQFRFSDGETDQRTWTIRKLADGRYEGRAGDVIGVAEGVAVGQALRLRYEIDLPTGDDSWRVRFDDLLLLQPDGIVINRASITKFGIEVAQMIAFFQKVEEAAAGEAAQ